MLPFENGVHLQPPCHSMSSRPFVSRNRCDSWALPARDQGFTPDFAVIDIGLQEITGFGLVAALRLKQGLEQCRFISISGYVLDGLSDRSLAAGFAAHLTKPVELRTLMRAFAHDHSSTSYTPGFRLRQ